MRANTFKVLLLVSDLIYITDLYLILDNAKRSSNRRLQLENASVTEDKVGCDHKAY